MPGVDKSLPTYSGIGVSDRRVSTAYLETPGTVTGAGAAGTSNYSQAGAYVGLAEPGADNTGDLILDTSGDQAAGSALELQILRAGAAGDAGIGAGYVWRRSGDSSYRGQEPPTVLVAGGLLQFDSGSTARYVSDMCTLQDGTVLVAYEQDLTASNYRTIVERRPAGSRVWSNLQYVVATGSGGEGRRYPCLIPIRSDLVLLAQWIDNEGGATAQIRVYRSTDQGQSWELHSPAALAASLDTDPSTGFTPGELSAAYNPITQNISMFGEALDNSGLSGRINNRLIQWADSRQGTSFEQVLFTDGAFTVNSENGGIRPRVVWADSAFVCAYIGFKNGASSRLICQRLASAYSALQLNQEASNVSLIFEGVGEFDSATDQYTTAGSGTAEPSAVLARAADGTLYVSGRQDHTAWSSSALGQWPIASSQDQGRTWRAVGSSAYTALGDSLAGCVWWNPVTETISPDRVFWTWSEGQIAAVYNFASGGIYDDSVGFAYIGGHTDLCLPGLEAYKGPDNRIAWEGSWLPYVLPNAQGNLANGTVTGTAGLGENTALDKMRVRVTTTAAGSQAHYWQSATGYAPGTIDEGLTVEAHCKYGSGDATPNGQVGIYLRVADGSDEYKIRIDLGTDGYRVWDLVAGAYIAATVSVDLSDGVALRASIGRAKCAIYHRQLSADPEHSREWTLGSSSSSLSNNTATPASDNQFRYGHINAASGTDKVSEWFGFWWTSDEQNGAGLYTPPSNPDDLLPIGIPGPGWRAYVADEAYISGAGGIAHYGDEYQIEARYRYGIENIDPSISPSPAEKWRSTSDGTEERIVWDLSEIGSLDLLPGEALFVALLGINFDEFTISTGDDSSPTVYTDVLASKHSSAGLQALSFVRNGSTARPAPAAAAGDRYLHRNAAAGGHARLNDGAGTIRFREIDRNTSGVWTGANTETAPQILLQLSDVEAADPTSGTLEIRMPHVLGIWLNSGRTPIRKIRLKIHNQETPQGDYRIGAVLIGSIAGFGFQAEPTQEISRILNQDLITTASGRRRSINRGPARDRFTLNWSQIRSADQDGTTNPAIDYILPTDTAGAPALAGVQGTIYDLQDLAEQLEGSTCLLLRSLNKSPTDDEAIHTDYGTRWSYGRIVSQEIARDQVWGNEVSDPSHVLPEIVFEEEV